MKQKIKIIKKSDIPHFIRDEYRNNIGRVAVFTNCEVVINGSPHYRRCSNLIDALLQRNQESIARSKQQWKHTVNSQNIIQYVA
jgi:hypothetical protein